ncbi:hypothetical protein E2C01_052099 [Portunus trituberculatus]|uniref:Uncharacterized protein n=1 Tax=Portunus trituberculatus TaxID=210409 RepID=A0A5B7GKR5_PORTR|nr:hypothetical protein [Portunus trituberculatus]
MGGGEARGQQRRSLGRGGAGQGGAGTATWRGRGQLVRGRPGGLTGGLLRGLLAPASTCGGSYDAARSIPHLETSPAGG